MFIFALLYGAAKGFMKAFEDYLLYKTKTTQNVVSEAQVNNFFCLIENLSTAFEVFKFFYF